MDRDERLRDLTGRGYTVLPGFLAEPDLARLRQDYAHPSPEKFPGADYRRDDTHAYSRRELVATFEPRLLELGRRIGAVTNTQVDLVVNALYADTAVMNFAHWHNDIWPIYIFQDPTQYLHVYVPFLKPERAKSNLEVLPCDSLAQLVPDLAEVLVESRARPHAVRVRHDPLQTEFTDRTNGKATRIESDLRTIAQCPNLEAGDALIMRGDVYHRTQDVETRRVAVSFRMTNGRARVSWAKLVGEGLVKLRDLASNENVFARILSGFLRSEQDELSASEVYTLTSDRAGPDPHAVALLRLIAEMIPPVERH